MILSEQDLINNEPVLKKELAELVDAIREAADALQAGDVIELEGLDERVETICMAAEKSTGAVAQSLESLMANMIAELEVLALHLKEEDILMQEEFADEEDE